MQDETDDFGWDEEEIYDPPRCPNCGESITPANQRVMEGCRACASLLLFLLWLLTGGFDQF